MKKSTKNFLARKWHRLPIGIVAALAVMALTVGSVFAAYSFLTLEQEIEVTEPMTIEYNLDGQYSGDWDWHDLDNSGDPQTLSRMAGDDFTMRLRISNDATNALTVYTVFGGQTGWFDFSGFPDGSTIPGDSFVIFQVNVDVSGSAPPGTYDVTYQFTRE